MEAPDVSTRYPEIIGHADGVIEAKEAILDGEIVFLEEDGKPSFSKLAQRSHVQDPFKIRLLSNAQRRRLRRVSHARDLRDCGKTFFEPVTSMGYEGIIETISFRRD